MAYQLRTKVVGVTFENEKRSEGRKSRQRIIEDAARRGHADIELFWERGNKRDKNALAVRLDGEKIGYIPREHAADLAPRVEEGSEIAPFDVEIVGGTEDFPIYGVHLGLKVKRPRRLP